MNELINNKNEIVKNYVCKALIANCHFFKALKLTKDDISIILNYITKFEELIKVLKYNNNLYDLLQIVVENENKIYEILEKEKGGNNSINVEEIIEIKRDDNIKGIFELYKKLLDSQCEKKVYFLTLSSNLCDKYISYLNEVDYEKLLSIKDIVELSEKVIKDFKINEDLKKKIHETGLILSQKRKLKNIDILNFIENDEYYKSAQYKKRIYRPLEVFDGLDIKSFNQEFYEKWAKIDWNSIFDGQNNSDFLKKVADLVTDLNDFNILFKLLGTDKVNSLNAIQDKFIELLGGFDPKKCPNFNKDINDLLIYSENKETNILLIRLNQILNAELLNEIYIKFVASCKDLTSTSRQTITQYFTTGDNDNPASLIYLINNCPKLSENILQNIDKFNIQKDDFFKLEENENIQLFKGLLNDKILGKNELKDTYYIKNANNVIEDLDKYINNGEITFRDISLFYNDQKNKCEQLISRLKMISKNDEVKANK
jgi:hypothetical protein